MNYTVDIDQLSEAIRTMSPDRFVTDLNPVSNWSREANSGTLMLPGVGQAEFVDAQFGSEGSGSEVWIVFNVKDELFKMTGFYSSWDGTDWNGYNIFRVEPEEVVMVIYRPISDK